MPGGNPEAWPYIKDIFQGISAKVGDDPCCDWVGPSGAGHYVKMVHNGIEYGDMQLCCEAYHLMKTSLGMSCEEMSGVFREWDKGELKSFLVEITADILAGANIRLAPPRRVCPRCCLGVWLRLVFGCFAHGSATPRVAHLDEHPTHRPWQRVCHVQANAKCEEFCTKKLELRNGHVSLTAAGGDALRPLNPHPPRFTGLQGHGR
jgi:hypothetical protein